MLWIYFLFVSTYKLQKINQEVLIGESRFLIVLCWNISTLILWFNNFVNLYFAKYGGAFSTKDITYVLSQFWGW